MAKYRSLKAWRLAHQLARRVSRVARTFPRHEQFELAAQLRRAALSVPTNIVEGRARFGAREFLRFVRIAASSLAEVEYLLFYAYEEGFLPAERYAQLDDLQKRTTTLVYRLARSLERGLE